MEKQRTIQDSELGELHYDSEVDWYEAKISSKFGIIKVNLGCDEYSSLDELLDDLRTFCRNLDAVLEKAFKEIINTMIPLKNETWLSDDEAPIKEQDLLKIVQNDVLISLNKGGTAEMFFSDGGLFGDHSIVVWHHEDGTVGGAHLAG